MTREEAKRFGHCILAVADADTDKDTIEFTKIALEALEQDTVPFDFELYQAGLMDMPEEMIDVLDKIRAEIEQYQADCDLSCSDDGNCKTCNNITFGSIYRIIDKYRKGDKK